MENTYNLTDIHCHLLPGVDDGSASWEETLQALKTDAKQQISSIIMTPHHYPDKYETKPEKIRNLIIRVKELAEENNLDFSFYAGQECLYHYELPALLEQGEVLTLADSRYVLVEFLEDVYYRDIIRGVTALKDRGFVPILAHYERYKCLMEKERLSELKEEDVLLQMNFDTVQRTYGFFRRNPFQEHLKKGFVDFMGSDCHGINFRKFFIPPSLEWMENNLSDKWNRRILENNPQRILKQIY